MRTANGSPAVEKQSCVQMLHCCRLCRSCSHLTAGLAPITLNYTSPGLRKHSIRLETIRNVYSDLKPEASNTPTSPPHHPERSSLKEIWLVCRSQLSPSQF